MNEELIKLLIQNKVLFYNLLRKDAERMRENAQKSEKRENKKAFEDYAKFRDNLADKIQFNDQ